MSAAIKAARQPRGRGDPGLFGFLGKAARGVLGVAGSIVPGPIGAGLTAIHKATGRRQPLPARIQTPEQRQRWFEQNTSFAPAPPMPGPGVRPTPGIAGMAQRAIPGGAIGYEPTGVCIPKGYKLNETGYHLKDGTYVPPNSKIVKIRKRNPLNPRAASKAISRLESAKKASERLRRITIRKKPCNG